MPIWVFRILNAEGNVWIASHIGVFGPAFGAVDEDMGSIVVAPNGGDLRRPVLHERCQLSECFLLEQIVEGGGNRRHVVRLLYWIYVPERTARSKFTTASPLACTVTS